MLQSPGTVENTTLRRVFRGWANPSSFLDPVLALPILKENCGMTECSELGGTRKDHPVQPLDLQQSLSKNPTMCLEANFTGGILQAEVGFQEVDVEISTFRRNSEHCLDVNRKSSFKENKIYAQKRWWFWWEAMVCMAVTGCAQGVVVRTDSKGWAPFFYSKSAKNHPTSANSPVGKWIFFSIPEEPLWRSRISSGLGCLQLAQQILKF